MSFKIEAITLIPALIVIIISMYLSFLSLITIDQNMKKLLLLFALSFFFGGIAMAIGWIYYWAIYRKLS